MRDFHLPGRSAVYATNGMAATSHPLASKVAVDLLERGGNAVDAAIGAAVLLGLCEPQMTGLGGDCFVLLAPGGGDDRILALNGSGRAPAAARAAALREAGHGVVPLESAHAVTVPGAVDAFCRLSQEWGRLGLAESLAPAIRYAEEGVPVAPRTAFDWSIAADRLSGRAREAYLLAGAAPRPGEIFRAPGQAEVLRRIARDGRRAFYEGEVAEDMLSTLRAAGGAHAADDFAHNRCDWAEPVAGRYKGVELVEHPPNGQGATAILMANILSQFDLSALDPMGADRAHLEAEAAKLAYDARNRFMADPDRTARLAHMLDPETALRLAQLIRMDRVLPDARAASEAVHRDTVYLTVVDRDRMTVSLIYSIFHSFGAGLASDKFGILFQNRGAGFTLEAGHPNEYGPGRRPMHTIIPAMLREGGRPTLSFGVMGGQFQPAGHVRLLTNLRDYGMELQEAVDRPRSFPDGGDMKVERGYDDSVLAELADRGHRIAIPDTPLGGAQAIRIHEDGMLEGASDPRKDGCALGY
ncbi:MAG: gamma-glutamyltransferase [Tranquillimonas sp.]